MAHRRGACDFRRRGRHRPLHCIGDARDQQEPAVVAAPAPKAAAGDRCPWPRYLGMLDTLVLGAVMGRSLGIVLVFTTDDAGERVFAAMAASAAR